jgi:lipopolysaccharide export system protein LptA
MRTKYLPFLIAALLAPAASAEKADREKEIVIGADVATADDVNRTSTWDGNVIITQGTMRITAARVVIKEDARRFKHYTATGAPVTFRQKRDNVDEWVEGFAQRVEFDEKSDMLRLFDNARVKSNQNEITGEYIAYDMRRELAEVTGAPPGQAAPPGTRVKVIIVPAKKEAAAPKADAPAAKLKPETGIK